VLDVKNWRLIRCFAVLITVIWVGFVDYGVLYGEIFLLGFLFISWLIFARQQLSMKNKAH
jgi:hypothetical protein